jgi:3-oxoadipate enol-lactonase
MNFVEVNGTALRYELSGRGVSTLVLIHEMGGTLESWDFVRFHLAGKRQILRYDTRGAGLSQKVSGALSIDTMTDDLVSLMDTLGISGRVVLVGVAVGYPRRVAAVVVSSPAIGISPDRRLGLLARVEKMEKLGLHTVIDTLDSGYPAELRGDAQRFAEFRARWLGGDPISYGAIYRMLIHTDLQPELPLIACPVLVTAGTLDRVRPPHLVEPVAQAIPAARYAVLETGHYAPVQTPELYARTIGEFLASVGV